MERYNYQSAFSEFKVSKIIWVVNNNVCRVRLQVKG